MESVLPILLGLAMLATLIVLVVGIVSFGVHGRFYQKHSNNLMRARVLLQGVALLFLGIIVFVFAD